ncbi:unnamed protein product, partial [Mesorhabditis belari]|uniref:Uncharacterized protein n=1 Tax=Mesorhabditis belari TaxID=2138241 RepID=A0AAF3EV35_9BILA
MFPLLFILEFLSFSYGLEGIFPGDDIITDKPNRFLKMVRLNFNEQKGPFVLRKNSTLLTEKGGAVEFDITTHGYHGNELNCVKVELEIEKEEVGKLYSDFSIDDIFWEGRHWAEVIGNKERKHEFVVVDGGLMFGYNKNAPDFKVTLSETDRDVECRCGVFLEKYNDSLPNYLKYASQYFVDDQPKTCSNTVCGWAMSPARNKTLDIEFTFKGNLDSSDKFYVRSSKGIINLSLKSNEAQKLKLPGADPLEVYFISGANPKVNRHLELQYSYENIYF